MGELKSRKGRGFAAVECNFVRPVVAVGGLIVAEIQKKAVLLINRYLQAGVGRVGKAPMKGEGEKKLPGK